MKIILAGLPKTGTNSIREALTMLGYQVYDAENNFEHLHDQWTKIMTVGGTADDFREMYKDIDATCDVPACHYWEEMHKAFPDAKILLMVRDTEEEWLGSMNLQMRMLSTCGLYSAISRLSPHCSKLQRFLNNAIRIAFGSVPISPWETYVPNNQALRIAYRNHNARVLQVAPKDKLLVYKCSEGWPKLCKFLGCQIPDDDFPHKNKKGEILKNNMNDTSPGYRQIKREITVSLCAFVCGIGYLAYVVAHASRIIY
uniref:Uncharacterized LOC100179181 n=1 Tax=Ciona intestinalis TaxID=7719 RepID=F6VVT3_CIOIN|nr:uncharacterized protein LOC100179181 [Ciona intestinalis]XP_026692933.1 uncharacterized protein LOC100179181 [Ciona intestinalis]|eukprot:XP_002126099.1 uncharacterized protein LOC100179181 [Ciona intestinalis]